MSRKILISGAMVADGSGADLVAADILIEDDLIADVFPRGTVSVPEDDLHVIHAEGHLVTPGFIDIHAHSDLSLLKAPDAFGKISQGVTTEVSGNCGLSPFPVTEKNRSRLMQTWKKYDASLNWSDLNGYVSAWEKASPTINSASFCGHNTLRSAVLGYADSPCSDDNVAAMKDLLDEALEQGALGFSTGLLYVPGKFASKEELLALMTCLKKKDAVYATHLRSEGDSLLEALSEAIALAEAGSGKLQISHLKTALEPNWCKLPSVFEKIDAARERGVSLFADRYPYTYGQTNLSVILPPPYDRMPDADIQNVLNSDAVAYAKVLRELRLKNCWERIILTSVPADPELNGMPIGSAASKSGMHPADLILKLLRFDCPGTLAAFGGLSRSNMMQIIAKDYVCCGTDETARPADFSLGTSHPRGFGAFPEFYRLNRQNGLAQGETIRKMTSLPASILGLEKRGRIQKGFFADILILREPDFAANSSFLKPHEPASGVKTVIVNGKIAFENGHVAARNGRFLKKKYE